MTFQFMKNRYTFLGISAALILVSLLLLMAKGLNYGIDFVGGSIIRVRFHSEMDEIKIREAFVQIDQKRDLYFTPDQIVVQAIAGSNNSEFIIRYPAPTVDTRDTSEIHDIILNDLKAIAPFSDEDREISSVGPTIGDEMKRQGIMAALFSIVGILLYLAYRFELQSATGAIVAIIHDLFITLGFLALIGIEFDITVLAAVLTLLGYSVNDSIVILDRVRENRKISKETDFALLIDDSINQTLSRTINTSLTTLMALLALLLMGGVSIHGFALTLTFGMIVGTYSSIFISTPVLLELTGKKLGRKR